MADRVVLHIGAPKSGTTFLQTLLWHHQEALRADGVLVPGRKLFDHNKVSMVLRNGQIDAPVGPPRSPTAAWRRLKSEIEQWPGTAVLSNEWMALAPTEHAAAAVRAFGPTRTDIVFTARAPVSLAPAAWQESLKTGHAWGLDEFLVRLTTGVDERWRWSALDPAEVLPRWSTLLPPGQVCVVTVPPGGGGADPKLLWTRFAEVLGIDPAPYDLNVTTANESLSAEAAALLHRIGPLLLDTLEKDGWAWNEPYRWIREYVAHGLLVPEPGARIGLRSVDAGALLDRAGVSRAVIQQAGYRVIGDLDDLVAPETRPGRHPDDVTDSELLQLAIPLLVELFARLRREVRRVEGPPRHRH